MSGQWLDCDDTKGDVRLFCFAHAGGGGGFLLAELERLNGTAKILFREPELLHALLPVLRADFELNDTYAAERLVRLPVPISAFVGQADPLVDVVEVRRWAELTTGEFRLRIQAGDHFYLALADGRRSLLDAIVHDVTRSTSICSEQASGGWHGCADRSEAEGSGGGDARETLPWPD